MKQKLSAEKIKELECLLEQWCDYMLELIEGPVGPIKTQGLLTRTKKVLKPKVEAE